jgi:TBC1 domain family member 8/9
MSTISTQLRNFKDPTKDELTEIFFSIPPSNVEPDGPRREKAGANDEPQRMEINATLSIGPETDEESYVRNIGMGFFECTL